MPQPDSVDTPDQIINKSLELLYGSPEDVIKGINQVLLLLGKSTDTLVSIVQNHQLMSALARLLGDDSNQSIELMFSLGKLFLSLSLIEDFHQILSSHRVGALTLGLVELEIKRAQHRGSAPALLTTDSAVPANCVIDLTSQNHFSKKQERLLFVCLSILDNLADDSTVLKKMIKKSLVDILIQCILHRKPSEYLFVAVSLLNKTSAFADTSSDLSRNGRRAISQLTHLLSFPQNALVHDAITTLFNISFHQECANFISAEKIHSRLLTFLQKNSLCNITLKLIYHLTSREEDRQKLYEAKITPCLMELLAHVSANEELDRAVAGILVNMTVHPLCCEELMRLGGVESIFSIIKKSQRDGTKQILLKVARNLGRWTKCLQCKLAKALENHDVNPLIGVVKDPEAYIHGLYWEHHFWGAQFSRCMQYTLACENDDLLVEWLGIMNNFTRDDLPAGVQWHDQLDDNKARVVDVFNKLQDSCHDDIKLELIIWIGELCSSKECCIWLASTGLLDIIHKVFADRQDSEMRLQILLIYERCLLFEITRFHIIGGDDVVGVMLGCLTGDSSLRFAAEMCLLLIEEFDCDQDVPGHMSSSIRQTRYELIK